jgi:hypothetical protein
MKKLILPTLLATFASGCILTASGYEGEVGYINASWSFRDVAGATLPCPTGFNTAEVTAVSREFGDVFIDLYNCDARGGSAPYPIGSYDVTIAITTAGGTEYGHSLTQPVDIVRTDANVGEDFVDDGGRVLFDWVLQDATTNDPVTCADQPAVDTVSIVFDDTVATTKFDCTETFGVSEPVVAGAHAVSIAVLGRDGEVLGEPQTQTIELGDRNDYVDLGSVTLPVGIVAPD